MALIRCTKKLLEELPFHEAIAGPFIGGQDTPHKLIRQRPFLEIAQSRVSSDLTG